MRPALVTILALSLMLGLSACGKRGALRPPPPDPAPAQEQQPPAATP